MASVQIPVNLTPTPEAIPASLAPILRGEQGPQGPEGPQGPAGSGSGATNLAYTASATGGTVTSDTGTDATLPLADGTNAGLMAPAQHSKLAGLPSSADAAGTAASAVSAHAGAADPHGDRAWASGQFAATGHNHTGTYDPAGTASAALSAHTGAADPHPGYALESALGTAAALNVPATGDAASGEVVKGSDSRLSDARTPTAHNQAASTISDSTTVGRAVLTAVDAAAARSAIGAGTSSFDGAYSSLSGKPTLGDAAAKNTGTAAGTVAAGDHTHSGYETSIADAKVKSVTVLLPVTNDEITLFRARAAMTITKMVAIGGGFTYTVRKAADRSATGTEVVTGGSTVTSTTTGDAVTSFNSASIAAGDYVWLKLTSVTGTPASFNLTMEYT